jgi:hypothetical protein
VVCTLHPLCRYHPSTEHVVRKWLCLFLSALIYPCHEWMIPEIIFNYHSFPCRFKLITC